MHLTEPKKAILRSLRHGPLTQQEIETDTGFAPFQTRAELRGLRTDRMVRDHFLAKGHLWELTPAGMGAAWAQEQLRMSL